MGLAIAILLHPLLSVAQPAMPSAYRALPELRGVWLTNIDSEVLFSQQNLHQAMQRLHRLNFNTVYPTVWNWGYTLYPSAVAEQATGVGIDPHPGLRDRDMLQEAITEGHALGMAVVPWVEFGLMAPADSELAARHPDWITQRQDGSQIVMEGEHPRVWLNPNHPQVQNLMIDLVSEIAANYEVDGIQFDDHFGMPVELGYDDYTIALYQQEHNGQSPPTDVTDPEWVQWRADQITDLHKRVFYAIKANRPDCLVALSPNPREFAYETYLQDWWRWEREGLVEEIIIQIYRSDLDRFVEELERPEIEPIRTHIPLGIGVLTGLKNRPVDMAIVQDQVKTVRERGFAGVSFFFYESLGDRDRSFRVLFPTPAARPSVLDKRSMPIRWPVPVSA
ncbi:MAG: glycoside hydrolase family 10 protein [Synechococcales cyanobacterium T60_A2020_003]|nr:glycoside hydrolase family 10 protein [Synechococcales cyanobacterium T60_A2020_003]